MKEKEAIILFTRIPLPGQTKTRLMPTYTPEECAQIHSCFLRDQVACCQSAGRDLFLCYAPQGELDELYQIYPQKNRYFPQISEGLGLRMLEAIRHVLSLGYQACVLLGSDIPEVTGQILQEAFHILAKKDLVFGPTEDGGYYLVGMKKPISAAFNLQDYGKDTVLQQTLQALEKEGYQAGLLDSLSDIDSPADLLALGERLAHSRSHTALYLKEHPKISVIVPIYNEKSTIVPFQKELEKIKNCEIILVDGGSQDGTQALISPTFTLLSSQKGRANQMNTGALHSSGTLLFFLHCDSILPENAEELLKSAAQAQRWGGFGIVFDNKSPLMALCAHRSNQRMKRRGIVFGDQGIFIPRSLFFQVGLFPDLPIMEDYQLSLTLADRGIPPLCLQSPICTSARRFQGGAKAQLSMMWTMHKLQKQYRQGVNPQDLLKQYDS